MSFEVACFSAGQNGQVIATVLVRSLISISVLSA